MPLIIPFDEIIEADMSLNIRKGASRAVLEKAIELGIGTKEGLVVRDAVMGDVTDASVTDWKDVETYGTTAQVAGQENWSQDSGDITANALSGVIKGAGTTSGAVKNKAVIGVFGFFDRTQSPDLTAIRFKRGSNTLDFWEVEQCYIGEHNAGMINGVIIWEEDDPLTIDMNFMTSADKFVGLHMIVCERYDTNISSPY